MRGPVVFTAAPPPRPPQAGRSRRRAALIVLLTLLGCAAAVTGGLICFLAEIYDSLPTFEQLHDIDPPQVSRVYGADGSLVHEFSIERRIWVPFQQIPAALVDAVVSTEDRRFYRHWGIDMHRIVGATLVDLTRGHYAQGGSTITQQLARNLYLTAKQSLVRKIREAMTAVQLEAYYTKQEILESYLNQVYLGAGAFGVQAASLTYFSKDVHDLDVNECATLAGTIQLPERFRPDRPDNANRARGRRRSVLRAMVEMGRLTPAAADSIGKLPVPAAPLVRPPAVAPYFIDMVRGQLAARYGDDMLYNGGLTIYTTIDPAAQDSIERAVPGHLDSLQRRCNRIFLDSTKAHRKLRIPYDTFLVHFDSLYAARRTEYDTLPDSVKLRIVQVAVVAMDVRTGGIRAMVGGRDFTESKFNRATQARRQPGSAFKAFVYTAAVESGLTPCTIILDQPITLPTDKGEWRPENYDKKFYGPVTIRAALAKSINLVAIQVLMQVGAEKVVECARRLGLRQDLPAVPALAIGAAQATPLEMTAAYASFPTGGWYVEPYCIEKVVDRTGRVLEEHTVETKQVLRPHVAFIMTDMMRDVVLRGTGARINSLGFARPSAGKTGTTNDYSDAWFIGFTPQICCAVWVGVDERRSMGRGVTGSDGAIPLWVPAMSALHRNLPRMEFAVPDSIQRLPICLTSHRIATSYCPQYRDEYFITGSFADTCDEHRPDRPRREQSLHQLFGGNSPTRPTAKDSAKPRRPLIF